MRRAALSIALALLISDGLSGRPAPTPKNRVAAAKARNFRDGTWSGKTVQGKSVSFEVRGGRIREFRADGIFKGSGCSSESGARTTLDQAIAGNSFTINSPGGPGGISMTAVGKFPATGRACGTLRMTLHPIPGPPPGVPGHVPSCAGSVETAWTASPDSGGQDSSDFECPGISASARKETPEPPRGAVPAAAQASASGYFISALVLGDPPDTVRLGQLLRGRVIIERGAEAPGDGIAIELYWKSPSGMLTNLKTVAPPSRGREAPAEFEIRVFSRADLERTRSILYSFKTPPPWPTELTAVVEIVQGAERKEISNKIERRLKIIED